MPDGGFSISPDKAYAKALARWRESEEQRLLLEVKLEELVEENGNLKQETSELKKQIEEMIAAKSNGRSVREVPEDALQN